MDSSDTRPASLGADLLDPDKAADELGVAPATLAAWRSRGTGPAFVKLGARLVRYQRADLSAFVASQRRLPEEAVA